MTRQQILNRSHAVEAQVEEANFTPVQRLAFVGRLCVEIVKPDWQQQVTSLIEEVKRDS